MSGGRQGGSQCDRHDGRDKIFFHFRSLPNDAELQRMMIGHGKTHPQPLPLLSMARAPLAEKTPRIRAIAVGLIITFIWCLHFQRSAGW